MDGIPMPVVKDVMELWQLLHSPVGGWFGSWVAVGRVTMVTPYQVLPVSWQVVHPIAVTAEWFIGVPEKAVNLVGAWQLSQAALPTGICVAGGVTTVTPKKPLPLAWQLAQPDEMPAWFIVVPLKLVNLDAAWHVSQGCPVGI